MLILFFSYFQQYVSYKIKASYDDKLNILYGEESIIYRNNSNKTLDTIYFNLFYNSMRFGSNLHKDLKKRGWNIPVSKKNLGYIKINEMRYDTFEMKELNDSSDIMMVILPEPIKPNETKNFYVKFELKIPYLYTRFGKSKNHIIFAYWYPQISCFDEEGWHIDGYRIEGEFYNEFGDYYVELEVPAKYTLFGTGEIIGDEKYISNLEKIIKGETVDTTGKMIVKLNAKNVHDFTWFIDRDVIVQKRNFDGTDIFVVYNKSDKNMWKDIPEKVERIIKTYNEWIGKYPYNDLIVFSSPIVFGGMEYPQMVSIGRLGEKIPMMGKMMLEETIAHEIAHQWFYGILGNNEMDYAFLDESFATFFEERYMKTYYPDTLKKRYKYYMMGRKGKRGLYNYENSHRREPIIGKKPYEMKNYYLLAYNKGSSILEYIHSYLGEERFNMFIREYFETCKFTHPSPNDFFAILSSYMSDKRIKEIKKLLYSTENFDFYPEINKKEIILKKDGIDLPIPVRIETDNGVMDTIIFNKISLKSDIKSVFIDPENLLVEKDEWNNSIPRRINVKPFFMAPDDITALNLSFLPLIYKSTEYYYGIGFSISQIVRHNWIGYFSSTKDGDVEYFIKLREGKFHIFSTRRKYIGFDMMELKGNYYDINFKKMNIPLDYPLFSFNISGWKNISKFSIYYSTGFSLGSYEGDEFLKGKIGLNLRLPFVLRPDIKFFYNFTKGNPPFTEKIYLEGRGLYDPSFNIILPFNNYSSPLSKHFSSGYGLSYYSGKNISGESMFFFDLSFDLYLLKTYFRSAMLDKDFYSEFGFSLNLLDFNIEIPVYPFEKKFYLNWVVRL